MPTYSVQSHQLMLLLLTLLWRWSQHLNWTRIQQTRKNCSELLPLLTVFAQILISVAGVSESMTEIMIIFHSSSLHVLSWCYMICIFYRFYDVSVTSKSVMHDYFGNILSLRTSLIRDCTASWQFQRIVAEPWPKLKLNLWQVRRRRPQSTAAYSSWFCLCILTSHSNRSQLAYICYWCNYSLNYTVSEHIHGVVLQMRCIHLQACFICTGRTCHHCSVHWIALMETTRPCLHLACCMLLATMTVRILYY